MPATLRVLILEDRAADAELMLHELRRAGYALESVRVDTEADFLAHLDPEPEVILADYTLPQFEAKSALRLLQDHGLDIPCIIVTGSVSEEAAVECMKSGAADYLLKDRLVRLGPAVAQALEAKRLREEKRRLPWRLLRAQEEERRLAAYDLHDGPVQQLAAASMFLERAAIGLAASAPVEAAPALARAREHVSAALARIRRIVAGLRPPDLDDAGLVGALDGLAAQQRERASAQIEYRHVEDLPRLDPEVETVLYHIAEEALSNAVRHSGADRITILLEESGDTATLTIQDTGRGFSREEDQPAHDLGEHVGLSAMRERAEMLGGTFEIRTEPGNGTTVTVRVPIGRPG